MRRGQYLLLRSVALQPDSWTYGDWRQYIAFRDNGDACCVKISHLPFVAAFVGLILLLCVAVGVATWWEGIDVPVLRLAAWAFAGFLLIGPQVVLSLTDWRLVKVVLTCTRDAAGGWRRDLP